MKNHKFKVYLGRTKDTKEVVYLNGFEWDCGWYWGGGYIGNRNFHAHFDGAFLDVVDRRGHSLGNFCTPWDDDKIKQGCRVVNNGASVWCDLDFFLTDAQYTPNQWWRIKDLYKQFYALKECAEVFQHGGHCTSQGRNKSELSKQKAFSMNRQIERVVIPEIIKALGLKESEGEYYRPTKEEGA